MVLDFFWIITSMKIHESSPFQKENSCPSIIFEKGDMLVFVGVVSSIVPRLSQVVFFEGERG